MADDEAPLDVEGLPETLQPELRFSKSNRIALKEPKNEMSPAPQPREVTAQGRRPLFRN
jgi:hypothetical protein